MVVLALILALVCFVLAAVGANKPAWNWVPIGLAFLAGAFLMSNLGVGG